MTYCLPMRRTLLLLALCLAPLTPPANAASTPAAEAKAASGVEIVTDLRAEYLVGFPLLVTITVRNPTDAALSFPDLGARPHLVRFELDGPKGKSERFTTPPETDPGTTWSIPARSERRVILEVPSSAGFPAGAWSLGVRIEDPAGALAIPARPITLAPARPIGGTPVWEPTIAATSGLALPWVHQATSGFDLYLMQYQPKQPTRVQAQYHLTHLDAAVEPVLSRSRPNDAQSRFVYWMSGSQALTLARVEGQSLRVAPKTVGVPYPNASLLGRGITDAHGGLVVPLWIPAPSGAGGDVKAMQVDDRGRVTMRTVGRYTAKPTQVATAIDASSTLVLAIGDAQGVILYRVDPAAAPEIPAKGARVWKAEGGWAVRSVAFDTLPPTASQPGGLALLTALSRPSDTTEEGRTLWSDLAGKVFLDTPGGAWTLPGTVRALLPGGYGSWYALSQDAAGAWWYAAQGATPAKVSATAASTLWSTTDSIVLRSLTAGQVATDQTLGPRQP